MTKLPESQAYKPCIFVYSREKAFNDLASELFLRYEYTVTVIRNPNAIIPSIYDRVPLLIVADVEPQDTAAMIILANIKTDSVISYIPVVLLGDHNPEHPGVRQVDTTLGRGTDIDDLLAQIALLIDKTRHQLDVNPFSLLPGHHTTMEQLRMAIELSGVYAACHVMARGIELVSSMHGIMSADVLYQSITDYVAESLRTSSPGGWFLGQSAKYTVSVVLPRNMGIDFAQRLVDEFDHRYPALLKHATQASFSSFRDPNVHLYSEKCRLSLVAAIQPLDKTIYPGADELMREWDHIGARLKHCNRSVLFVDKTAPGSGDAPPEIAGRVYPATETFAPEDSSGTEQGLKDLDYFTRKGEIRTHFQPIVDYWEMNIHAFEALSRFRRKDGTLAHPEMLFDTARQSNLLIELDLRCLRMALQRAAALKIKEKIFLNINRETFIRLIHHMSIISECGVRPEQLVFELTEHSLRGERSGIMVTKKLCDELGIGVAFDDAGTGAVSFREIGEIRPRYIKLDRAIIAGITRSALKKRHVLSMRAFARGAGAMIVAEGIEMGSEFDYLKSLRMDYAQGFFIAKPAAEPPRRVGP